MIHPIRAHIVPSSIVIPLDTMVAVHSRAESEQGPWLLIAVRGFEATTEQPGRLYFAVDFERACGLIAQLRFGLKEAGVAPQIISPRVDELTAMLVKQAEEQ